ncbi:SWIB-domain-containing protein [Polychaeton citri CBS 116435]|uniref:SWIB-domain-containing protein n=1 Tax=Polychaeton citri CBS 116435 TaxID=1314669 RepID=A0A9P4QDY4_9PEZI|nr:SWIB-domain-containing protein [Polychaeton citri CBS 116435]
MALTPEQTASYSVIIDDILAASDLDTVSAKRIRKGLQERVEYDLTPHKQAITDLIMERFDVVSRKQQPQTDGIIEPQPTVNGSTKKEEHGSETTQVKSTSLTESPTKRKATSDLESDISDVVADSPPAPKKAKKSKVEPGADSDAAYAARLQAELNAQGGRTTRGGGAKPRRQNAKKERKPKKKSSAKIGADDDSELSEVEDKPEKEKKGGFHVSTTDSLQSFDRAKKPMILSEPLSAMLGETSLSRPQTVKKIWQYVKERELQEPTDKRQIRCDEAMRAVFRQDKVHMFTMNKLLATHLHPADEVQ